MTETKCATVLAVLLFGGLAGLPFRAVVAQGYDEVPERYLVLDQVVQEANNYFESLPNTKSPEIAEAALRLDDVTITHDGNLSVTLRNDDWRTITAWSIGFVFGASHGSAVNTSYLNDYYNGRTHEKYGPLEPGGVRLMEYALPRTEAAGWKGQGEHDVVHMAVDAVVFDDGTFAGRNLKDLRHVLEIRHARAVALEDMLASLEDALRMGTLEIFLDRRIKHQETLQASERATVAERPNVHRGNADDLNAEWLSALRVAAWRSGDYSEVAPELDDLRALKSLPQALYSIAEHTVVHFREELDLVRSHLPVELRTDRLAP